MNELRTSIDPPHLGDKRPAEGNPTEDTLPPQTSPSSPLKKKKKLPKLDPAAQSLLCEIFALQDTLSEDEIEALARKVNYNFFSPPTPIERVSLYFYFLSPGQKHSDSGCQLLQLVESFRQRSCRQIKE